MNRSITKSRYTLSLLSQSDSPIEHTLQEGRSVFIGAGDSCGIKISGNDVAEIHCLVDVDGEDLSIQDWASNAGTRVNGQSIDDKTSIKEGDQIQLGSVLLVVGSHAASSTTEAPSREKPREDSVGMEHVGVENESHQSEGVETPPEETRPVVVPPPMGRLSDNLNDLPESIVPNAPVEPELLEEFDAAAVIAEAEAAESRAIESHVETVAELCDEAADKASCSDSYPSESQWDGIDQSSSVADDFDWDPSELDEGQVDAEIVQLLKSEIEDLRIQVAERDEQLAELSGLESVGEVRCSSPAAAIGNEFESVDLVQRVDHLLGELAEHDERVSTLQELLQTAEVQNQAEREERNCLENWVGEIEQRIGEKESEWQAEQDSLRDRLTSACGERDQVQQQLHAAAQRYGNVSDKEPINDEVLQNLQKQNAELQSEVETSRRQLAAQAKQLERLQNEEPESLQEMRAELAQEKASVSRLRFQLSQQLQDISEIPEPKDQPDREFAYKLQTLREHLREIHEEEKVQKDQKGDSLLGRISNLWKRVDDEY